MTPTPKWLQKAVFYEIYPQSFFDTNGDGKPDLNIDTNGDNKADINIDTVEKTKDIEIDEEDTSNAISNEIESATVVNIEVESLNTKEEKIDAFVESCESVKYSSPETLKEILTKANGMCNLHNLLVKATTNSRGQKIYNELKDKNVEILFK